MPRLTHTIRTRFSRLKKRLWHDVEREQRRQAKRDMNYWIDNGMTPPPTTIENYYNFYNKPSAQTTTEKQAKKQPTTNKSVTKSFEQSIKESTKYMKKSLKKSTRTSLKAKLNTKLNTTTTLTKKQKAKGKQRATSPFDDLLGGEPLEYEVTDESDIDARFCRTVHKSQIGEPLCETCARARHCARQLRRQSEDVATAAPVEEYKDARRRSLGGGMTPVMEAMYRETFARKTDDNTSKKDTGEQARRSFTPRAEEVGESSKTQQQQLDGQAEKEAIGETCLGEELETLYADVLCQCNDLQNTSQSLTKSQRRLQKKFARMQAYTDDRIRRYMAYRFPEISFPPSLSTTTSTLTLDISASSAPSSTSHLSSTTTPSSYSVSTAPTSPSSYGISTSLPPMAQTLTNLHDKMSLTASLLHNYEALLLHDEELLLADQEDEEYNLADVGRSVESVAAWMCQMCHYMNGYLAHPPLREEEFRRIVKENEERKRKTMEELERMEIERKSKKKRDDGGGVLGWELRRSLDFAEREFRAW